MTAEDVVQVCKHVPQAQVIAVHMEAINHCLVTRNDLSHVVRQAGVKVTIPYDGETVKIA